MLCILRRIKSVMTIRLMMILKVEKAVVGS